ncbi:hypothetical protein CHS0354_003776, partial [Potamilus streckersoni]
MKKDVGIPVISPREQKPRQETAIIRSWCHWSPDHGAIGSDLTTQRSGLITCPNNVLADVEILEILIGGER